MDQRPFGPSRVKDVHAHDESILEAIAVANARVGDELARTRVADYLMDIDRNAAVVLLGESLGLNVARDGGELPVPVVADSRSADDPTALPGVGPIDLRCISSTAASISRALKAQ